MSEHRNRRQPMGRRFVLALAGLHQLHEPGELALRVGVQKRAVELKSPVRHAHAPDRHQMRAQGVELRSLVLIRNRRHHHRQFRPRWVRCHRTVGVDIEDEHSVGHLDPVRLHQFPDEILVGITACVHHALVRVDGRSLGHTGLGDVAEKLFGRPPELIRIVL